MYSTDARDALGGVLGGVLAGADDVPAPALCAVASAFWPDGSADAALCAEGSMYSP